MILLSEMVGGSSATRIAVVADDVAVVMMMNGEVLDCARVTVWV
jgi:hypothetical protein